MIKTNFIEIGTKEFSFTILNINPQRDLVPLTMNINGLSLGTLESPTYIPKEGEPLFVIEIKKDLAKINH